MCLYNCLKRQDAFSKVAKPKSNFVESSFPSLLAFSSQQRPSSLTTSCLPTSTIPDICESWQQLIMKKFARRPTSVSTLSPSRLSTSSWSVVSSLTWLSLVCNSFSLLKFKSFHVKNVGTMLWHCSYDIGQTGLGKSTLINSIFASHLIDSKGRLEAVEPVRQTTEIQAASHGTIQTNYII